MPPTSRRVISNSTTPTYSADPAPNRFNEQIAPGPRRCGYAGVMLAAEIWHWWIGIVLTVVGALAVLQVVVGYLRKVVAPQHPKRRQRS